MSYMQVSVYLMVYLISPHPALRPPILLYHSIDLSEQIGKRLLIHLLTLLLLWCVVELNPVCG